MNRIGVMHLTDTLDTGGYERLAVNLVNFLPREGYSPYLCTTRREGPLADLVRQDVGWLRLTRKHRFDIGAIHRLVRFIRSHSIQVLHAHDTSLFIAVVASLFPPFPAVVWHDNFGASAVEERPLWLYRPAARRASGIIAANQHLAEWSRLRLGKATKHVWYIPNFVCVTEVNGRPCELPGTPGGRIVCVANLRPQKDHLSLLQAFALVIRMEPKAHLLLVGSQSDQSYLDRIRNGIASLGLDRNVSLMGQRLDVSGILRGCDIGVLSSVSEGLPLALLEYGLARLPAVVTKVGQCGEVLDEGRAGILVPPSSPDQLAEALLSMLRSPELRLSLGAQLHRRVQERYSPRPVIQQVCEVYQHVLSRQKRTLTS